MTIKINKTIMAVFIVLSIFIAAIFVYAQTSDGLDGYVFCYEEAFPEECTYISSQECAAVYGEDYAIGEDLGLCAQGCCCLPSFAEPNTITGYFGITKGYCKYLYGLVGVAFTETETTQFQTDISQQQCDVKCAALETLPLPDEECTTDADCDAGFICENSYCIKEVVPECNDDIDNDADDLIDADDPCCISTETLSEECYIPQCSLELENSQMCMCGGEVCKFEETVNGETVVKGGYCCEGQCTPIPCGKCTEGDVFDLGINPLTLCMRISVCGEDGTYGAVHDDVTRCNIQPENCKDTNSVDENNNGLANCLDPMCNGILCSESTTYTSLPSSCNPLQKSYFNFGAGDGQWECCFTGANDCDNDGINDRCGPCDCDVLHVNPYLTSVEHVPGESFLKINYGISCPNIDINIMKCNADSHSGAGSEIADESDAEEVCGQLESNPYYTAVSLGYNEEFGVEIDSAITPQTWYCYGVKAEYPDGTIVYSDELQCIRTGDERCFSHTGHFCLRETASDIMFACDAENQIKAESCPSGQICMEILSEGGIETFCKPLEPCIFCGVPFNMYGNAYSVFQIPDYPTSSEDEKYNIDAELNGQPCAESPICYYDFTKTVADAYDSCGRISTCYDYRSPSACQDALSQAGTTNKCLARNCRWQDLFPESESLLKIGDCKEETKDYLKCGQCSQTTYNDMFNYCSLDKCKTFTDDRCYIAIGDCADRTGVICRDYLSIEDCTNGYDVEVDVEYDDEGTRISGTNSITPSHDWLNFGVCKWKPGKTPTGCYKDADDNGIEDAHMESSDVLPPLTQLLMPHNVDVITLKLVAADEAYPGVQPAGVKGTWYCIAKQGEQPCYPNEMIASVEEVEEKTIPRSNGIYTIYYYSEDHANNLEVVESYSVVVDRVGPEITIIPYATLDQYAADGFEDSSILFEVTTNEKALCHDEFEDYPENAIPGINYVTGDSFQANYEGLRDGTYTYAVYCEDEFGNKADASVQVKVDADNEIQATKPEGILDYTPVMLEVMTMHQDDCHISQASEEFSAMDAFSSKESVPPFGWKHKLPFSIMESRLYEFHVLCYVPEQQRYSYDEIQFVYDIIAPETELLNGANEQFDVAMWYTQNEIAEDIVLECNDLPEFGFDCENTKYCLSQVGAQEKCAPAQVYDVYSPLVILPQQGGQWFCYQSFENEIKGMGGLIEEKKCHKIQIDSDQGPEIIVDLNAACKNPETPCHAYSSYYVLTGEVVDYDAVNSPPQDNLLSILIYAGSETDTASQTYEDIAANTGFAQQVQLLDGINAITFVAADRSGKTSTLTYYITVSPYEGELIELIEPSFGVSDTQEFDLIIRSPPEDSNLPPAESCKITTNPVLGFVKSMAAVGDNKWKIFNPFPNMQLETYYPVYVRCEFIDGNFDELLVNLIWDNTKPEILNVEFSPINDRVTPPTIVEYPLETEMTVFTDDNTRCKYLFEEDESYYFMTAFDNYHSGVLSNINKQWLKNLQDEKTYDVYVRCDNGPLSPNPENHISNAKKVVFKVDTASATGMYLDVPPRYVGEQSIAFRLITSKQATDCTFGPAEDLIDAYGLATETEGIDAYKVHEASPLDFDEGLYTYWFKCLTAEGHIQASFDFTVDLTLPEVVNVSTAPITSSLSALSASWEANDSMTWVVNYSYSIGTSKGAEDIYPWKNTTELSATVEDLALENMTIYYWNVVAVDKVGHESEVYSVETYTNTDYVVWEDIPLDSCMNEILDDNETDVDCGNACGKCANGKNCAVDDDCASSVCESGICTGATCTDIILNQDESDVDCGGYRCFPCEDGSACYSDSDCTNLFCMSGFCTAASCNDGYQNQGELGTDCGGPCLAVCELIPHTGEPTCFDAIKNQGETGVDCGGPCSSCEEMPPDEKSWWWLWLIIIILLIGTGGGGYYYYYAEQQKKGAAISPMMPLRQMLEKPVHGFSSLFKPLSELERERKRKAKERERKAILEKFAEPAAKERLGSLGLTHKAGAAEEKAEPLAELKKTKPAQAEKKMLAKKADLRKAAPSEPLDVKKIGDKVREEMVLEKKQYEMKPEVKFKGPKPVGKRMRLPRKTSIEELEEAAGDAESAVKELKKMAKNKGSALEELRGIVGVKGNKKNKHKK